MENQRDSEKKWVFETLADTTFTEDRNGQRIQAWPAVVDQGGAVGLRSFDTPQEAATEHHYGVIRLLSILLDGKLRDLRKHHGVGATGLLAWSTIGSTDTLIVDLLNSCLVLYGKNCPWRNTERLCGMRCRIN